jgi:signal transduction histidine kinase
MNFIRKLSRSLSARLILVFALTGILYVVAADYAVRLVINNDALRQLVGSHMALHIEYVLDDIGYPPDPKRAERIVGSIPIDMAIVGPDTYWTSDPSMPALETLKFSQSEFLGIEGAPPESLPTWMRPLENVEFARSNRHQFVKLVHGDYRIALVSPKLATETRESFVLETLILVALLVLMLCYFAVRWLFQPLAWIREGAARIGQGELDYRIATERKDDLGELAREVNHMADDVRDMLDAKQQLMLAISHELRSPLTRTKVALEFLEDDELKSGILSDVEEMEKLTADLLESERLNTRHSKLNTRVFDLCALAREVAGLDFPDSDEGMKLVLPSEPVYVELDEIRIRLLLKNLLENAFRYSPDDGPPVELTVTVANQLASVTVRDHGPGIAPEHLEKVTEPFYRADPARSRTTGGFGLGLYLCRLIAEAHKSPLVLNSGEDGTTVMLEFPLAAEIESV